MGAAEVAAILRREIAEGRLKYHDRLPAERAMAEGYGVARGTVRKALDLLARDELIEIRAGSGAYVAPAAREAANPAVENARPLELIDARFALEPHICRLAVLHARAPDLERVGALLEEMEASALDPGAFSRADAAFHLLLAEITGNGLLLWMMRQINAAFALEQWTRMRRLTLEPSIIRAYNQQHRRVVEAIRTRDPERAAALMKDHLETARLSLTRAAAA